MQQARSVTERSNIRKRKDAAHRRDNSKSEEDRGDSRRRAMSGGSAGRRSGKRADDEYTGLC